MKAANIFAFSNLYTRIPYWGKLEEMWSANLDSFNIQDNIITFIFYFDGVEYKIESKLFKDDKYLGKIFIYDEVCGKIHFTIFKSINKYVLLGDWTEESKDGYPIIYNILIEVIF
jgi:hypothetical protein